MANIPKETDGGLLTTKDRMAILMSARERAGDVQIPTKENE